MKIQKVTQEMLDNSKPIKSKRFWLKRFGCYLIMFLILAIFALSMTFVFNAFVGTKIFKIDQIVVLSSIAAFVSLIFLTEQIVATPKFVVKICMLYDYFVKLNIYNELKDEFEEQQNYLELHEKYKDII